MLVAAAAQHLPAGLCLAGHCLADLLLASEIAWPEDPMMLAEAMQRQMLSAQAWVEHAAAQAHLLSSSAPVGFLLTAHQVAQTQLSDSWPAVADLLLAAQAKACHLSTHAALPALDAAADLLLAADTSCADPTV